MLGRVATFSEVSYLMQLNQSTAAASATASTQEASGLISTTYGGLGSSMSTVLNVDNQITALTADGTNATNSLSSMQETYSVLGNVTTLATSMLSSLSSYMTSTTSSSSSVAASAATWLSELTADANTQYAGSYLFSGTDSTTAPVDTSASDYDPTADPTAADTTYYQGSSTGTTYTGSDGYTVATSVQADSPGFEQMFRALSMIIADPTDSSTLSAAYDLIQSGSSALTDVQSTLSTNTTALTNYQTDASDKVTTLTTLATSLKDSDVAAATVTVTSLNTQLEASYEAISKMMSDSLAQYLS
ncbi:MAG: flagellin [Caulobacteraceae bacterium]